MGFFESDIVQEEAKKLFTDYQELMKLGSDYGKFDRDCLLYTSPSPRD